MSLRPSLWIAMLMGESLMQVSVWGRFSALGLLVAGVIFVLDQLSKAWIVQLFWPAQGCNPFLDRCRYEVLPFLDFIIAWNTGISYGLLSGNGELGRWLLIGFSLAAVLGFFFWLAQADRRLLALSIGLIIGGAAGNVIDRLVYGAVADFVSLHGFGFYWYIFNVADIAIVAGAAGLLYEVILSPTKSP